MNKQQTKMAAETMLAWIDGNQIQSRCASEWMVLVGRSLEEAIDAAIREIEEDAKPVDSSQGEELT